MSDPSDDKSIYQLPFMINYKILFPLNFCYFLVAKVYLIYKDLKGIRQLKIHRSTFYNHPTNDKQNYFTSKLLENNQSECKYSKL